jgi:hypothetical protein
LKILEKKARTSFVKRAFSKEMGIQKLVDMSYVPEEERWLNGRRRGGSMVRRRGGSI